ncbi:hypothetical protein [Coleofasciculus sp. E1-EBD-02]|uniref:hypothetical protein n=1 Tax=Coleofasciculus sp. E1-EBD-02 TaxID=3068481 RepID=UPI0032FB78EE
MPVTINYQSPIKPIETSCSVWLQWLLVTLLGFVASLFWIEIGERPDINMIEGIIGGTIIGFAQWLVLRRYLSSAWWWIIASLLGWGVMGLSSFGVIGWFAPRTMRLFPRLVYGVVDGATLGLILGMAQWWVLRQYVSKAWGWIFTNTLYWAISLAVGWIVGGLLRRFTQMFLSEVLGLGVTWMLVAGLTGITLIRLLGKVPTIKGSGF